MRYRVLTAFFPARADLDDALRKLLDGGVPIDAIRLLPKDIAYLDDIGIKAGSKASEGAAFGAALGGLVGAATFALTAAGSLIVPVLDAVIAGPFVAALAGAGAGGALGVLLGALFGALLPEYEAGYLRDAVRLGGALIAVRCAEERSFAIEALLSSAGGRRIYRSEPRRSASPMS